MTPQQQANKRYYQRNKAKVNELSKMWRRKNVAKCCRYHKLWRINNPDKVHAHNKRYRLKNPEKELFFSSRRRAKERGLKHTISVDDIVIPSYCPILSIPLLKIYNNSRAPSPNSPSLDRIDNSKGYTPDNIIVISYRANTLKNNATLLEIQQIAFFYAKFLGKEHG